MSCLAEPRPPTSLAPHLGDLVKLVMVFRLAAVLLATAWLPTRPEAAALVPALLLAGGVSLVPLLAWQRAGAVLMRHPAYLALDVMLAVAVLTAVGTGSPFLYVTTASAALGGILYGRRGALWTSVALVPGYFLALEAGPPPSDADVFMVLVGLPALYPLAATAGAGIRRLLARQVATETALAVAARAQATSEERGRLARELHDSLAKTVQGIALSAWALAADDDGTPRGAAASALADSAQTALREARAILTDLRRDDLSLPFGALVERTARTWACTAGVELAVTAPDAALPELSLDARHELLAVLCEALTNVERHAGASRVTVAVTQRDRVLTLSVVDDGVGIAGDAGRFADTGRYGLVGMRERIERVGGHLDLAPGSEGGLSVVAGVPSDPDGPHEVSIDDPALRETAP